jgi:hypothetical protein
MKFPTVAHAFLACALLLMCTGGRASNFEPQIDVSPTSLTATLLPGEQQIEQLIITNEGNGNLEWQIIEGTQTCYLTNGFTPPADIPWLSVNPTSGTTAPGGSTSVDVTFDATGLTPGQYTDYLCVGSNASSPAPTIAVTLNVESPPNQPPACGGASPSTSVLWPPDQKFVNVDVLGVIDPDGDPVTITITGIYQDEEVDARGSGNTAPDGSGVGSSTAAVRAERSGRGNGRVYHISFQADDGRGGACTGTVMVSVPHDQSGAPAVDEGALYDSTITP